jgi:small-conductance mechanosensitive channel
MYKLLLTLAVTLVAAANAQVKTPPVAPVAAPPPPPETIPLTDIAPRGEKLTQTLRELSHRLPSESELIAFQELHREQQQLVRERIKQSTAAVAEGATLVEIREQLREWRTHSVVEARDRKTLRDWGAACEETLVLLAQERAVWEETLKIVQKLKEFRTATVPVRAALKEIQATEAEAGHRLRTVLDLQVRLSHDSLAVADAVEKLTLARQRVRAHLFTPDAPPLWVSGPQAQSTEALMDLLLRSLNRAYRAVTAFLMTEYRLVTAVTLVMLITVGVAYRIAGAISKATSDEATLRAVQILRRPIALAVALASPLALLSYPLARMTTVLFLAQLFLVPLTRLLPFYVSATRLVYLLAAFFAGNGLIGILDLDTYSRRQLLAILFSTTLAILAWWGRPARLRRGGTPSQAIGKEILFARWFMMPLAVILLTNVFGFVLLSHLLRLAILLCCCFGFVLYTVARVLGTLFAALVRRPRMRSLASVRLYEPSLVAWAGRLFICCAFLWWVYVTLHLLEASDAAAGALSAVLNASLGAKGLFSIGDLLGFLSVVTLGYLFASGVRFVLREEILPHWRLSRGVPETISNSLYYILLLLVFFMSLAAAGVQLDKLTVLTGAFGVGIGFGLQNVVNNFVSGLILQYERPIRVGDILEVGALAGEIHRIGVRSSTMRTFQGAEVIIPNSTLVSDQVINWTLSEPRRRVEIPIHTAYGTDPERVIQILIGVAESQTEVLRNPPPSAVFQGFGESSLDFLLMFWADQANHFRLRSDVAIGINRALNQAGIEIPFPQREVRLQANEPATFGHTA